MGSFLAHLLIPFSSQAQKTAFTRWLDHNVVASGNENEIKLRNTIKELPDQSGDFWLLVQEASELVANHQDDFRIPFSNPAKDGNQPVSTVLIEQWNQFQNQKSGFKSVLAESLKTFSGWISQAGFSLFFSNSPDQHPNLIHSDKIVSAGKTVSIALIPLISGISINAP